MTTQQTQLISKILPHLKWIEKIFLVGLTIGLVLNQQNINSLLIIRLSLIGLALTFFLSAFTLLEFTRDENDPSGFIEMLSWTIIPKVLWISSAISSFGLYLYTLQTEHQGHLQMFLTGGLGIVTGLLVLVYALLTGTKHLKHVTPVLLRATPILMVDIYFLFLK